MATPDPGDALPFGATVAGVRALALSLSAEGQRPAVAGGARRTSDDTVANWVRQAAGVVALKIRRYTLLPLTQDDVLIEGALTQESVLAVACHLVELYAGALLMDTNLPERSAQMRAESGRGPGAPLMDRFYKLLEELGSTVEVATEPGDTDVTGGGGAAFVMPASLFPPGMGF